MEDEFFLPLLEAVLAYMEIKEGKNPFIKHAERSEEFAYQELKSVIDEIERFIRTEG